MRAFPSQSELALMQLPAAALLPGYQVCRTCRQHDAVQPSVFAALVFGLLHATAAGKIRRLQQEPSS